MRKISLILICLLFTSCATVSKNSVIAFEDGKIAGEVQADINHIKMFTNNIRELNKREKDILNDMSEEVDSIEDIIVEIKILEQIYNEQISTYESSQEYEKISIARKMLIDDINSKIGIEYEK